MTKVQGIPSGRRARCATIRLLALTVLGGLLACQPVLPPEDPPPKLAVVPPPWATYVGQVRVLAPNAGWCWWQSQRAVIAGDTLLVGSVPNARGPGGATRLTQVLTMDLVTKVTGIHTLARNPYPDDDHDSPGLVVNPDGSVTAGFTGHGQESLVHLRTATDPSRPKWAAAPDLVEPFDPATEARPAATYANLVRSEGLLWNFTRINNRSRASWSADGGRTWDRAWLLLEAGTGTPEVPQHRPYLSFAANPTEDRIDFVTSDGHPKDRTSNALYSGYLEDMNVYRSDGSLVGPLVGGPGYRPADLTLVHAPPELQHLRDDVAEPGRTQFADADLWGSDLVVDAAGRPTLAFSTRLPFASTVPGRRYDHRYSWARWDGSRWSVTEIGHAGSELFSGELDYTGLVTIDPADPTRVVMSSDVHPVTGAPLVSRADGLVHRELFEGRRGDGGAPWDWRPITTDSTQDNIRPLLASGPAGRWALVWLQGTYSSWITWTMSAMVMTGRR